MMEINNGQGMPIAENNAQQPLGRLLVPVGETVAEQPKKKRRRQNDNGKHRRLIIHLVILVVLLALIGFGVYDFLHEGPRQSVPQPKASVQVDRASSNDLKND